MSCAWGRSPSLFGWSRPTIRRSRCDDSEPVMIIRRSDGRVAADNVDAQSASRRQRGRITLLRGAWIPPFSADTASNG
jgi:hypothetical protein